MTRHIAFVTALLLAGTAAHAQTAEPVQSTQTTTRVDGPYGSHKTTTTEEHRVDADGTEITKTKSIQSGGGALSATSRVEVKEPDGATRVIERTSESPTVTTQTQSTVVTTTPSDDR